MKTNKFCYSLALTTVFSLIPGWAMAAKAGDNRDMTQRPVAVDVNPAAIQKVPYNPCRPKDPPAKLITPNVKIDQRRPSLIKLPDAVKRNGGNKVSTPDPSSTANTPAGVGGLPADARIGNAARGLSEAREAAESMLNIPGAPAGDANIKTNLGLGIGGGNGDPGFKGGIINDPSQLPGHEAAGFEVPEGHENMTGMSSNYGQTGGNPLVPSTNPADWMSGAASGDADVTEDPETGVVTKTYETTTETDNGTTTNTHTSTYDPRTGESTNVSRSGSPEGNDFLSHARTERRDGSADGSTTVSDGNGGVVIHQWATDANDNLTVDRFVTRDGNGNHTSDFDRLANPPRAARMPTDDDTGNNAVARWLIKRGMMDVRPSGKVGKEALVNPDRGATADMQAPRLLLPEDQLVVNPDPDNAGGGAAPQPRVFNEDWKEKVKGPGGHPGDAPVGDGMSAVTIETIATPKD